MADAHANFAVSLVATAPSPASSGTSLVVTAATGTKFPAVPFNATIWPIGAQPSTTNAEIVRVTNVSTDTFTITRTQEGTSARTVVIGDQIAATITAQTLTDVEHDQYANTYLTVANETIPASTQVIYEDYLELTASFVYELASTAVLVIGDYATQLPALDQYRNMFVSVADEMIPSNGEVVFADFYELSGPFAAELAVGALIQVGTSGALEAIDVVLPADVTMVNANTFYDGPSAQFASGIWLICWKMLFVGIASSINSNAFTGRLWDGTTIYDEEEVDDISTADSNGWAFGASSVAVVRLASPTLLKLSGATVRGTSTSKISRDVPTNSGSSHTATRLSAIKIA